MKYGTMIYLVSGNGNVSMIKKYEREDDPNSGYCTLPGGKLNNNEKGIYNVFGRLEGVIREMKEEIGIEPIDPILRGVILFDNQGRTFLNWPNPDNFLVYIFYSNKYKGKPKKSNEGIPITVSLSKVREVLSNPGDKKMYEWLRDGRNFMGVIKHKVNEIDEEGTMVDFF
jgi:ADP-ribose pyrophosphatase YjhB (NUDIX family)